MRRGSSRQGQLESAAPLPHRSADDAEQESVSPLATDTDRLPAQTSASCTPGRSSASVADLSVRRCSTGRVSAFGVAPPVGPHDQSDTDHDDPQPEQCVTNAPEPGRPCEPGNHQAETGNHNPPTHPAFEHAGGEDHSAGADGETGHGDPYVREADVADRIRVIGDLGGDPPAMQRSCLPAGADQPQRRQQRARQSGDR